MDLIKFKFKVVLIILFLKSLSYGYIKKEDFFAHGKSVFFLHGTSDIYKNTDLNIDRKGLPRISPHKIKSFSLNNREFIFNKINNPEKTAINIQKLREKYESSTGTKENQQITFNLSLEYLKLYLHYLKIRYPYYTKKNDLKKSELVYDSELTEYLARSQYYINRLIYPEDMKPVKGSKVTAVLKASEDMSFKIENGPWLSVYFLAFIIETERITGNRDIKSKDLALNQKWIYKNGKWESKNSLYAEKTRAWLDKLWKRYNYSSLKSQGVSDDLANPDSDILFPLYDLFIKYDLLAKVTTEGKYLGPQSDIFMISDLKRAAQLQKDYLKGESGFYSTLYEISKKDSGNTDFLPYLYFAYRGYPVVEDKSFGMERNVLFIEYIKLYEKALKRVKYNIGFRKDIFQDIFFFGVDFNNLYYLEEIIFKYAKRGIQLDNSFKNGETGSEIGKSVKASSLYLISHILDLKRISSLNENIIPYENAIKLVEEDILSSDPENWIYLGAIYRALSEYYSNNRVNISNASALKYAKKAFMAFCTQINLTYGEDWEKYETLKNSHYGISFGELFLRLRNKYPTNPNGIIPEKFNADKILNRIKSLTNDKKLLECA